MHPFDAIALDGDGKGSPQPEEDVTAELIERWRTANAIDVPTIR